MLFGSSKKDKDTIEKLSWQSLQQKQKIDELNDEISRLKEVASRISGDLSEKTKEINNLRKKEKITKVDVEGAGNGNIIERGIYKSGVDFPEGKYDFYAIDGEGNLSCTKGDFWIYLSKSPHDSYVKKYRNLSIPSGSKIEVCGNLKLVMYNSVQTEPKYRDFKEDNIISTGRYKIGDDIPAGKYIIELKSGNGCVSDDEEIYINFGKDSYAFSTMKKARVALKKGKFLSVDGDLELYLYESNPISITRNKRNNFEERNLLCGGVYEAGIDIPYGYYNVSLVRGEGSFELWKASEEQIDFFENFSEKGIMKHCNLLVGFGHEIKIENSLEVSMEFSKPYINENISTSILRDIEDVKRELEILNNETIWKYYNFASYETITSEDCKNRLMVLKQKEKEVREKKTDISISGDNGMGKVHERLVRKILRTFNSECDNIMLNVGLKNIDQSRKKIQKSFETLNKLYSVDGIALTNKILELKLEQITLIYTYELKYQQEKDIQRAIKEQMLEEAKAQREIEEQKKKIEKDLQQHLGEINRMMKYMQKTQIDAEKQIYMEKIKELEEKIKVLESDKDMVLEREANAKAGFVYIISNIGSFGENIYKIGMTRRLEPMDRIHELSSASVPFEFDVHAMIFSSDAPELENTLHRYFANMAVNKVNPRKEFYNVDIDEIEKVIKDNYNDTVQFTKIPMAAEYRQSLNLVEKE